MDERAIGFVCGMTIGLGLVLCLIKLTKKEGMLKCRYDERQQLIQGRGFKYGFLGWAVFNAACIVIEVGFEKYGCLDKPLSLFLGSLCGIVIYVSYCIWNRGYFSMNEYPRRVVALFVLIMMLNFACGIRQARNGLLENGVLTFLHGANFLCAAAFLIILSVLLVRWCFDKRKAE